MCFYVRAFKRETERESEYERKKETSFVKAVVSPVWWWSHCNAPKLRGERV